MSSPRFLALAAFGALVYAGALPSAQLARELHVAPRAGQSFITWRESPQSGVRYRVYRAETAITNEQELAAADWLGEVDDQSSRNQGRSLAAGAEHMWVIANGGTELAPDRGLFVHTLEHLTRKAYYAVTGVVAGVEDRMLVPGANTTTYGMFERPELPQPVLQNSDDTGEVWGHWVG